MGDASALRTALQMLHRPGSIRAVRGQALPQGMQNLLLVAAREPDALTEAARNSARDPDVLVRAARFFVEQILLAPDTDSFRVLGSTPDADSAELKRNMALLMSWLHPDASDRETTIFARRVTAAWNDLKTDDRRRVYAEDIAARRAAERQKRGLHRKQRSVHALHGRGASAGKPSLLRSLVSLVLGPRKA